VVYGRPVQYHKDDGRRVNELNFQDRLVTDEILAWESRLNDVLERLVSFGIDSWRILPKVENIETLEVVADALESDKGLLEGGRVGTLDSGGNVT
jgi:hypothetical protein